MASTSSPRVVAATLLGVVTLLAGCASPATTTVTSCIDWVGFDTPADAAEDADAVIIGEVGEQSGTTTYYEMPAAMWEVSVDAWVKGGGGSSAIVVTSLPRSCGDTRDSMADAVDAGPVVLFLRDGDQGWETLTPFQGVVATGVDGAVPAEWPTDLYD